MIPAVTSFPNDPGSLVLRFSQVMYEKLVRAQMGGKKGWTLCTDEWLILRLKDEVHELEQALTSMNRNEAIRECADVANFAAMLADNLSRDSAR